MSPANDDVYHWNTFSPRAGITYRLNESGKTVVKAHYGRYYKLLEAAEFRAAVPTVTTLFNFTGDFGGPRRTSLRWRRQTSASIRTSNRPTAISSSPSSSSS